MPPAKRTVHVRSHMRNGKKVRSYSQQRDAWKKAGIAMGSAGASGTLAVASVLELGFTLISTIAVILTALLSMWAAQATAKAAQPRRTTRSKARSRTSSRSGSRSGSRSRTRTRK